MIERRRTVEALQESEARFRAIFADTMIGIVLSDTQGRFLETNPAMQRMLGRSEDELRGIRFPEVTHPDDVELTRELSQELRAGKREYFRQEKRYIRKDGRIVWGDLTVSLVRDSHGEPRFVIGMVEYITERKRAEEELRIRAHRQAAVADLGQYDRASPELTQVFQEAAGVVAQTLNLEHSEVLELLPGSDAWLLRAGVGWSEGLVGRTLIEAGKASHAGYTLLSHGPVIAPDLSTETRFTLPPRLHEQGIVSSISVVIPGKDRPFGVLAAHSTLRRSFSQDDVYLLQAIAHVLATAIERRQADEEQARYQRELAMQALRAQQEERNRVAHELHDETVEGLSTLLDTLDLLSPHLPTDGGLLMMVERAQSIARHTLEGTHALVRTLRSPILDEMGLVPALQGLAQECKETFRLPIELQAEPAATTHLKPSVENTIFRVAQEALTNACKHSKAERIRLRVSVLGDVVELLVEDNGRGFHLNWATLLPEPGRLGLSSMREWAVLLGGELSIETAPGNGTRVVLRVPLELARIDSDHRLTTAQTRTGRPITVLLVDHHTMVREGLRAMLDARPGITVIEEAEDGRQAIHKVDTLHPDVVVLDIAMPKLNGLDAARQIRRRFPDVKVIILTAHASRELLLRIVKLGAAAYVSKRSAGTELMRAIEVVAQGKKYVSPTIAGMLLEDYQRRIDEEGDELLTEREREVLQLVAEGRTNQEIARELVVSVKTVEGHRTKIMRKLGAHDRTDLVKYAIRTGMISPDYPLGS